MQKQQDTDHFIGRSKEIQEFTRWLDDPNAPWILYIHDEAEEFDKKGGVGKTWLLRRCADLIEQTRQDIAIVKIDFFNVGDRDYVFLAEKIVAGIQQLYPTWKPTAFHAVMQQYRIEGGQATSPSTSRDSTDTGVREIVSVSLAEDLHHLEEIYLTQEHKTLLVLFDTFEAIEQNPEIAVLRRFQTFPDTYNFAHVRCVIAGRNKLDWSHPNWRGREQEVQIMALSPFSQQEMLIYVESESVYEITPQSKDAHALYERTEGRPIIIGLVIDVLNHRILTLTDLLAISENEFESRLVPQVNKLENPLNWVILFMAHVYHRFNMPILEWILQSVELGDPSASSLSSKHSISREQLALELPTLSFVRQASSGGDFVLHDEMRRLVTKYCWGILDTDRRFRKDISRSIIRYYKQEIDQAHNEQTRQGYIIEMLYHRAFVDPYDGLEYFQEQFQGALRFSRVAFGRLLLQEIQKFSDYLTLAQRNDLRLAEVRLLRNEENSSTALEILQSLKHEADPDWFSEHQIDILVEEGRNYQRQSKSLEAIQSLTQGLEIERAREVGKSQEDQKDQELQIAYLLFSLGLNYRRRGQFATALNHFEQSIAIYKKWGQRRDYANTLSSIGIVYRWQGKIEEALRRCKVAWLIRVELFEANQISESQVGASQHTLGQIYLDAGAITEAEKRFQEAFDIYRRVNYKTGIATIYNRFGQVEIVKGDLETARSWFIQAQEIAREVDIEQYINSLNKQGRINALQHKWKEAAAFFEQAIAIAQPVPDYYQQTESLIDLANTTEHLGQSERARQLLRGAEEIANKENYLSLHGQIEQMRGDVAYKTQAYTQAFQHYALYCRYMAEYNKAEFSAAIRNVIDALLGIPKSDVPTIVQGLLEYWSSENLDKNYPELVQAFGEIDTFMVL